MDLAYKTLGVTSELVRDGYLLACTGVRVEDCHMAVSIYGEPQSHT